MRHHSRAFVLCLALLAPGAFCSAAGADLAGQVRGLVSRYESSTKAICGVAVVDLRRGEELVNIRSRDLFVPASNQKILTSAFALASLGPGFEFTTSVYRLGDDIVVVGDGDPLLGDPRLAAGESVSIYRELDRWAAAVLAKVGPTIKGDLLVASRFTGPGYRHPDWPAGQASRWYCAPVSGLNFHDNCFDVTFTVTGKTVEANVVPASPFIKVISRVRRGKRHLWSLTCDPDQAEVRLAGSVRRSTTRPVSVAVADPLMLLGRVFAGRCLKAGISLRGRVRKADPAKLDLSRATPLARPATLLAQTRTSLAKVMMRANKRSLNLAAECLFLRAGDGTWAGSAAKMRRTLVERFDLDGSQLVVRDGGGLSKLNRVSPRVVCRILGKLAVGPGAGQWLASLPRSGTDGSLARRLGRRPYAGRILAKTGHVTGASCLSGYVLDDDWRVALAFSVLVGRVKSGQSWRANDLQDAICRRLVKYLDHK